MKRKYENRISKPETISNNKSSKQNDEWFVFLNRKRGTSLNFEHYVIKYYNLFNVSKFVLRIFNCICHLTFPRPVEISEADPHVRVPQG
jgi:hypothetical protein